MAATSKTKPGILGVVYRNTGTYGSPTWTSVSLVRDAIVNTPWDMAGADARATRVKLYAATQQDFDVTLNVLDNDADTGVQALKAAANTATPLDLLIMDGPITDEGARGVRAHFLLSQNQDQSIGNVNYNNFTCKPAFHTDGYPKYVVAGSGSALTYTAPGA